MARFRLPFITASAVVFKGVQSLLAERMNDLALIHYETLATFEQDLTTTTSSAAGLVILHDERLARDAIPDTVCRLKAQYPAVRLVVLTEWESGWFIRRLVSAGAAGVVRWSELETSLVDILDWSRRQVLGLSPTSVQMMIDIEAATNQMGDLDWQILALLAAGYSRDQIQFTVSISRRQVHRVLEKLRSILQVTYQQQIVPAARSLGLLE